MKSEISLPGLIAVILILLSQSVYLFLDARKHGHNYWFWGIVGLIQAPVPLLVYLLAIRKVWKKDKGERA